MSDKYHMHLHDREIKDERELQNILLQGKYAVVALCRANEPYLVTLNYGYDRENDTMYFHSAPAGLKLQFIQANPKVCATVIEDKGYLTGKCAHAYRSVVLVGEMSLVHDPQEKEYGMRLMLHQQEPHPEKIEDRLLKSPKFLEKTAVLKLTIKTKKGKEGQ